MTTHTCPTHTPGTRTCYVNHKCRCPDCRKAHRNYEATRTRQILYGRTRRLTDATPARHHLATLRAQHIGLRTIANATGLGRTALAKIANGTTQRIDRARAERIFNVQPIQPAPTIIAATGTRRRLQALHAIGYPIRQIAARTSLSRSILDNIIHGRQTTTTAGTHRTIIALYDELWNQPPALTSGTARAVARARREGWPVPLAWDDDQLDNPDAHPNVETIRPTDTGNDVLIENVRELLEQGRPPHEIAHRLDYRSTGTLGQRLRRAGRRDLARPFWNDYQTTRRSA